MTELFERGGNLLWVAPSGGRDRPGADGVFTPAPFDPPVVELMRKVRGRGMTDR